jgi:hypothetical protein
MSVYKEKAMLLELAEKDRTNIFSSNMGLIHKTGGVNSSFIGSFGAIMGFDLSNLSPGQEKTVNFLREFCRETKEDAHITTTDNCWTFEYDMDEGPYGWKVIIQKLNINNHNYLGLSLRPFSKYEE